MENLSKDKNYEPAVFRHHFLVKFQNVVPSQAIIDQLKELNYELSNTTDRNVSILSYIEGWLHYELVTKDVAYKALLGDKGYNVEEMEKDAKCTDSGKNN